MAFYFVFLLTWTTIRSQVVEYVDNSLGFDIILVNYDNTSISQPDAKLYCQTNHSGHLISVKSQAVTDIIIQLYNESNATYNYWIGLERTDKTCITSDKFNQSSAYWKWSSGETFFDNYSNWENGEPNNCNTGCLRVKLSANHEWGDWGCTPSQFVPYFVCQSYHTNSPTNNPNQNPSISPSSTDPTSQPSTTPTNDPSHNPTIYPSINPSSNPTQLPTNYPANLPSKNPSNYPTQLPTNDPTNLPSFYPSNIPSLTPSQYPSNSPTSDSNKSSNEPVTSEIWFIVLFVLIGLFILIYLFYIMYHKHKNKVQILRQFTRETRLPSPFTKKSVIQINEIESPKNNPVFIPGTDLGVETAKGDKPTTIDLDINDDDQSSVNDNNEVRTPKGDLDIPKKILEKVTRREEDEELYENESENDVINEDINDEIAPGEGNDDTSSESSQNNQTTVEGEKIESDNVKEWTTKDVLIWLNNTVKLSQYNELFENNNITGESLLSLNDDILFKMGIISYGHRFDILKFIAQL